MRDLNYCPECGRETLSYNDINKWSCTVCNFVLYHNVAAAVAVIIRCGDEILFTQRNQEPALGKLDLAGGFTDPKESGEETCARELNEELGIKINPSQLKYKGSLPNTYLYKNILYNTLDLFYEYEVENKFEMKIEASEIQKVIWIKTSDINIEDLAFDSQKKFFSKYLQ